MEKLEIELLVHQNLSQRDIAKHFSISQSTVKYWLNKFELKTFYIKEYLCLTCGEKDKNEFYGKQKEQCKKCFNQERIRIFSITKRKIVEEMGGKCSICGYKKYIGALEFHHLDRSKKDKNFRYSSTWSYDRMKKEVENCILLCANCHREVEHS